MGVFDDLKKAAAPVATTLFAPAAAPTLAALGAARGKNLFDSFGNPLNTITGAQDARLAAGARQQGLENAFGSVPQRRSLTDEDGNLLRQFGSRSSAAANQLRDLASGGADPIRNNLLKIQNASNSQALQNVAAQNQSNLQSGFSALASQGGLSGGARERLAANSNVQGLLAQQRQGFDNQQALRGINADAAQRRFSALGQVAGFDRDDRTLAIGDLQGANQDNINRSSALLESRLASRDAPQGGLFGFLSGITGGIT